MIKTVILTAIVLGMTSAATLIKANAAQQITVTRTVMELSDFPALADKAKAVCGNTAVKLSDNARAVCDGRKPWPSVTKAGAFRNAGVGAEFNTLMRQ